jgi:ribosomal protein S18 acetylase RimI-like enzyme
MEVAIRPIRPDDWDGVFQLDRVCFEPPYRLEYPRLRALIEDSSIAVVVIEAREGEETAIVGSLMVKHEVEAGRLVLIGIMVDPGFRHAGLGRRLAGWAERMARARSLEELLAPLEAENEVGAGFLTALGFTREPGVPPFFDDPAGGSLWRRKLPAQAPAPAAQMPAPAPPHQDSVQAAQAPSAARESPAPEPQESDSSAGSQSRECLSQPAEVPVPALPQPVTPARFGLGREPDRSGAVGASRKRSAAAQGADPEPPPSAASVPEACAAPGTTADGADSRAAARTPGGPRSRERRTAAAEPAEPAERLREAQQLSREAQKKIARRKRRRT